MNFDLLLHDVEGPFRIALEGSYFDTEGYMVVKKSRRGSIDIEADSRHSTFNGRVELVATPEASLFVSGTYYDEERGNGTPLQFNRTGYGAVAVGGRLGTVADGEWRLTLFADDQKFRSTFSTQAADRNSETRALDQRVPTTSAAGVPKSQTCNDIERIIPRARLATLFHATPTTDLRASAYQGFRVPTVNEQYRVFRVRNDVTVANATLRPELLVGGELGVQQRLGPSEGRVTGYWNEGQNLVANVTTTTPLFDCPAGTTCRQRQNLDLARIRGVETELELRLSKEWRFVASYLFADARVVEASQQPGLEGKRLAQVPEHSASVGVRFQHPGWFNASLTARFVGDQYEDDLNTLPLGNYIVVDLMLSRAISKNVEIFAGVENLFDQTYSTGRTSEGVVSIGAPLLARAGLRLSF